MRHFYCDCAIMRDEELHLAFVSSLMARPGGKDLWAHLACEAGARELPPRLSRPGAAVLVRLA